MNNDWKYCQTNDLLLHIATCITTTTRDNSLVLHYVRFHEII